MTPTLRTAGPFDCDVCGQTHVNGCHGHKDRQRTVPCRNYPRKGINVCTAHGGNAPQVRVKAAVRAEVLSWGLGDSTVDPGETLLRLVTQSAWRANRYATEIERVVDEADGDLHKALIGDTYTVDLDGRAVKTGEYIRAMTRLEAEERDRCANFATKAIAAGLAERQVRLAERQVEVVARALIAAFAEMGLSVQQQQEAKRRVAGHLRLTAG